MKRRSFIGLTTATPFLALPAQANPEPRGPETHTFSWTVTPEDLRRPTYGFSQVVCQFRDRLIAMELMNLNWDKPLEIEFYSQLLKPWLSDGSDPLTANLRDLITPYGLRSLLIERAMDLRTHQHIRRLFQRGSTRLTLEEHSRRFKELWTDLRGYSDYCQRLREQINRISLRVEVLPYP